MLWRGGDAVTQGNDVTAYMGQPSVSVNNGQNVAFRVPSSRNGPFNYEWERNGQQITSGGRFQINAADGTLQINDIQDGDAGNNTYTVTVSNAVGSVQRSIAVVAPTRLAFAEAASVTTRRPLPNVDLSYQVGQTAEILRGRTLQISAVVYGTPAPSLRWRLPSGRLLSPGKSSRRVSVLSDGTLVIRQANPKNAGTYVLTATNARESIQARSDVRVVGKIF